MPPKPPLTHFLCIPLITDFSKPQLQASLHHFTSDMASLPNPNPNPNPTTSTITNTNDAANNAPDANSASDATNDPLIPPTAIRPLGTLHLTLGVMSLPSPARLAGATSLLGSLDLARLLSDAAPSSPPPLPSSPSTSPSPSPSLQSPASRNANANPSPPPPPQPQPQPLKISLLGLSSMHADPAKTSILYATPQDPTSRLRPFCEMLRTLFTDAGYILPDDGRGLLLHATIVNTIYARQGRRSAGGGRSGRGRGRGKDGRGRGKDGKVRFDARGVVGRYEGFEWMRVVRVERIAICEMGAREVEGREGEGVRYVEVVGREMPWGLQGR